MISELVTGMLRVVEECDREEGEIRLVMEIFPPFSDLFRQIWAADTAFARQCMQHYTSWLQGPPNRPTEDEVSRGKCLLHACLRNSFFMSFTSTLIMGIFVMFAASEGRDVPPATENDTCKHA